MVATWNAALSEHAQTDVVNLWDNGFGFARQQLIKNGEFFPFGQAIGADGTHIAVAPDPSIVGEQPLAQDLIDWHWTTFTNDRDEFRAVGIFFDITIDGGDAVVGSVEHVEGPAISFVLPYTRDPKTGGIDFLDGAVREEPRRVWSES